MFCVIIVLAGGGGGGGLEKDRLKSEQERTGISERSVGRVGFRQAIIKANKKAIDVTTRWLPRTRFDHYTITCTLLITLLLFVARADVSVGEESKCLR